MLSPVAWSGHLARPVGGHHPLKTGLGGGESSPRSGRSPPQGPWGAIFPSEAGRTGPGGDGQFSPGGGRGILQGL